MVLRTLLSAIIISTALGCGAVRFQDKERLADPIMMFDPDPFASEMMGHMIAPREASIGGFNSVGAGGCSCK